MSLNDLVDEGAHGFETALQGRIHLVLDGRHRLKFIQVVPEIVVGRHSGQMLGGMFNAIMMALRPQQYLVEGLRLTRPLHPDVCPWSAPAELW